jgi:hypothetical protein
VWHFTCTHQGRVDSRLLVVRSQIASLILDPSFDHNLCCRCQSGTCEAIFDIYTSRHFQWYKEHLKARCFDPCNRVLNFLESRRTPSSTFWECESHRHTCLKVGLWHWCKIFWWFYQLFSSSSSHSSYFFKQVRLPFYCLNYCLAFLDAGH